MTNILANTLVIPLRVSPVWLGMQYRESETGCGRLRAFGKGKTTLCPFSLWQEN